MNGKSIYWATLLAVFLGMSFACCKPQHNASEVPAHDLTQIKDSGFINILTLYSPTTYFRYRGVEMGYQYELSMQFAEHLGVKANYIVAQGVEQMLDMLQNGEGDLIAYNIPITRELKEQIKYVGEEHITHQVLVQRRSRTGMVSDVTELVGKEVYATSGKFHERLEHLNQELGGGIGIHKVNADSLTNEDLITKVWNKEIDFTIADVDEARLNQTYYSNLDISLAVSYDQRESWVVRKDCPLLAQAVNEWYKQNAKTPKYSASAKRYFEQSKSIGHSPILSIRDGKISNYDPIFKRYAKEINWDWRLLASLAYTESNFDTAAVSWAGARGLMQLMPATALHMGVPPGKEQNPEESVKGAVKYISITNKYFAKVPEEERMKFVLAAYNSGIGHVFDAMALAEKYGKNKYMWDNNVDTYLILKNHEEYFSDPVCKNGYFRGIETSRFVSEILQRFNRYKEIIKE